MGDTSGEMGDGKKSVAKDSVASGAGEFKFKVRSSWWTCYSILGEDRPNPHLNNTLTMGS